MLGIKNIDDLPARGEVWYNELRLAGLDNNGGWAAIAAVDANLADFANVTATGNKSTPGFGSVDQRMAESVGLEPVDAGAHCRVTYHQGLEGRRGSGWLLKAMWSRAARGLPVALAKLKDRVESEPT